MKIAFFDPGLALLGYAIVENDRPIDFGAIATSSKTPLGDRLIEIRADVLSLLQTHKPDIVAFEKPFFLGKNTNAAVVQFALGVMLMAIAEAGYPSPTEFKPSQIKLMAAGAGNASKLEVKSAAIALYGLTHQKGTPDDAYDALAGAYTAMQALRLKVAT